MLKFKVIGSRTVCDTEPGKTFTIDEENATPGYVGEKKDQRPSINVPALLLGDLVSPANAETREWASKLTGAEFASKYGETPQKEEEKTDA